MEKDSDMLVIGCPKINKDNSHECRSHTDAGVMPQSRRRSQARCMIREGQLKRKLHQVRDAKVAFNTKRNSRVDHQKRA